MNLVTTAENAIVLMGEGEAREKTERIKHSLADARQLLLEMYERKGWEALGYASWREYGQAEFGYSESYVYRLLEAAKTERQISPRGEIQLPEKHLRPLTRLEPEQQRKAWREAVETAPDGKVTGAHVERVVARMTGVERWLSHEEWDAKPYEYVGECYKQCYAPRIMTKGSIHEYGVNGVYVCSGCGYAYPPNSSPEPYQCESQDPDDETDEPGRDPITAQRVETTIFSSRSEEYYTPTEYIEAARTVLGEIDLDPASCAMAQETVRAKRYFTKATDGLVQAWYGRVFLNPPYGTTAGESNQGLWAEKLIAEHRGGNVEAAVLLVKAALGYEWFERLWYEWPVCFPRRRLSFRMPDGSDDGQSKQASALFYFGEDIGRFVKIFRPFGRVIMPEDDNGAL